MHDDKLGFGGLPQDFVRAVLTVAFDKLIHDLSCSCEFADPSRASEALLTADWTVKDVFEAWYEEWLTGQSHA